MNFTAKRCGCGKVYKLGANESWSALGGKKIYSDDTGALCEQRDCAACSSTLTIELVRALSFAELASVYRTIGRLRPSFLEEYTAAEILRLMTVYTDHEVKILPDDWTSEECGLALAEGKPPAFNRYR